VDTPQGCAARLDYWEQGSTVQCALHQCAYLPNIDKTSNYRFHQVYVMSLAQHSKMLSKRHCCYFSNWSPAAAAAAKASRALPRSSNGLNLLRTSTQQHGNHCPSRMGLIPAVATAAAAAAGPAQPPDIDQLVYVDASVSPEPFVGPIAVVNIPGRQLVATLLHLTAQYKCPPIVTSACNSCR